MNRLARSGWSFVLAIVIVCVASTAAHAQTCGEADWVAGASVPGPRSGASLVYDRHRNRLVMFGGRLADSTLSSATWELVGGAWAMIPIADPPSARVGHAMVFDSVRNRVVMFGGMTATVLSNATYEYDGTAWTQVTTTGTITARQGHAMAYDSIRQRVVLHGGTTSTTLSGATYEYDGAGWTQRATTGPSARQGHAMAYDSARHVCVLFGGRINTSSPETYSSATWEWDGTAWVSVSGPGPEARGGHCMAYDAVRGRCVLFGGQQGTVYFDTEWEYAAGAWVENVGLTGVGGRVGAGLAFDSGRGVTVLACGTHPPGVFNDTWELTVSGSPPVFSTHPQPAQVSLGQNVTFHGAVQDGSPSWRWRRNLQPLNDGVRISGATTGTLTLTGVTGEDFGSYDLQATNGCGTTASHAAALTQGSTCGTADFNGDGDVGTDSDIEAFFACLAGNCCGTCGTADFNGDGDVGTDSDIEGFFRVLAGGVC